jgi:hypothetical protein
LRQLSAAAGLIATAQRGRRLQEEVRAEKAAVLCAHEMQAELEAERGEQARERQLTAPQLTAPQLTAPQLTAPQLTAPQLALPLTDSSANRNRQVAAQNAEWAAKLAAVWAEAQAAGHQMQAELQAEGAAHAAREAEARAEASAARDAEHAEVAPPTAKPAPLGEIFL